MNRVQQKRTLKLLDGLLGKHVTDRAEANYRCPFCEDRGADHIGTLHVNVYKDKSLCHTCSYTASKTAYIFRDLLGYFPKLPDIEDEQYAKLTRKNGRKFTKEVRSLLWPQNAPKPMAALPTAFERLLLPVSDTASRVFHRYLARRGVTDEQIERHGIGFCTSGRYRGRVVFPCYEDGVPIYFTTRHVLSAEEQSKSLHPKVERRAVLWGIDHAKEHTHIVVVEGVFDALSVGDHAIAVLSSYPHEDQIAKLEELVLSGAVEEITVMFDADSHYKTRDFAARLVDALPVKVNVCLLKRGDPNDNRERIHKLLAKRTRFGFGDRVAVTMERAARRERQKSA